MYLLCTRKRKETGLQSSKGCELKKKVLKKNFKNIWRIEKLVLSLQPLSLLKQRKSKQEIK